MILAKGVSGSLFAFAVKETLLASKFEGTGLSNLLKFPTECTRERVVDARCGGVSPQRSAFLRVV